MKLSEEISIAQSTGLKWDDLITDVQILENAQHGWQLLEELPRNTRLTRTQIGWMIEYPDGETCKHERTASACVNTYWKHQLPNSE